MIISSRIWISSIVEGSWKDGILVFLCCAVSHYTNHYLLRQFFEMPTIVPTVLGTALAFFIGFNNNQAYDRWWEARKIWGAIVNDSRTWARQIVAYTSNNDSVSGGILEYRKRAVKRHIAFLYALKESLRDSESKEYATYLSEGEYKEVERHANHHNAILNIQSVKLAEIKKEGSVDGFDFLALNDSLIKFSDEMGMCERIKNTVFPTTYQHYTRVFIWTFLSILTIVTSNLIGSWSVLVGSIVGLVFIITHAIGLALLNPFNELVTGVPIDQITRTIEINLLQTIGENDIPSPVPPIEGKYVM